MFIRGYVLNFIELHGFTKDWQDLGLSDDSLASLLAAIISAPKVEELNMKSHVGKRIVDRLTEFAQDLRNNKVISAHYTCRRVVLDLHPTPYDSEMVKKTRELLGASQMLFAQFLGVSVKAIRGWEQGRIVPSDMACRFMDEMRHKPESV